MTASGLGQSLSGASACPELVEAALGAGSELGGWTSDVAGLSPALAAAFMPRSDDTGFDEADSALVAVVLDDETVDVAAVRSPSFSARGQPVAAINVIKKTAAAAVAFFN